jgi:dienelactone hydrolase
VDPHEFQLQANADRLYQHPRRLSFRATSPEAFSSWQTALRSKVKELLGIAARTLPTTVQVEKMHVVDRGSYREEKFAMDVGEGVKAPLYILVPKTEPPYKPILVFHGHNPSVQYILGNYPDEETACQRLAVDNNYAQVLAQAGYLVCAVEQRGFGERITPQVDRTADYSSCRHLSFSYLMQGRTLLGERCWDGMVALTYLENRQDVIPGRFGCTGNSGGGTTALWLSVIDERIKVVVPSCYFCSFKDSILGVYHCECNYVPGTLEYFEMGDLAASIAPRSFRAIAGQLDHIFPVAAVEEQFETVRRAYGLLGVPERCSLAIHPGGHAYHHQASHQWFGAWL